MKGIDLNRIDDKYIEVEPGKKMREGCEINSIPDRELLDGNVKTSTFGNGYENIYECGYMKKEWQHTHEALKFGFNDEFKKEFNEFKILEAPDLP
ncbi:hypothetical protein ACH5RR_021165 [Cinchona calisaya]|uniref:Uncharacterized protein n=1 Tax=Cinchona calisaya TaxID=153742 RepID=A0ABD2ZIB6_9GENT